MRPDVRRLTFVHLMGVSKFKGCVLGEVTIIVGTLLKYLDYFKRDRYYKQWVNGKS